MSQASELTGPCSQGPKRGMAGAWKCSSQLSVHLTSHPLSTAALTPPGQSFQKPLAQDVLDAQELEREKDRHNPA